jgi:hypothetical protein
MPEERKISGHIDVVDRATVAGWAADEADPNRHLTVRVFSGEQPIGRAIAQSPREDLKGAFEGSTGEYGFTLHLDPPLTMWKTHAIRAVADEVHALPGGGIIHAPESASIKRPLVVSSSGRAGSSLLMSRLARHPDILVAGSHPYEVKMLSYFALSFMLHAAEADRKNSLDPDKMGSQENRYLIGRNPYNAPEFRNHPSLQAYWSGRMPAVMKGAYRTTVLDYYDAQRVAVGRTDYRYFAEKSHTEPELRGGIRFLFPETAEIVLIRDPRDLLCSYEKFFGSSRQLSTDLISAHLAYITNREREGILIARYEDLVLDQEPALHNICNYLDLRFSAEMLEDEGVFERHGTSASPKASIGRWRIELDDWRLPEKWEPFMTAFGYI